MKGLGFAKRSENIINRKNIKFYRGIEIRFFSQYVFIIEKIDFENSNYIVLKNNLQIFQNVQNFQNIKILNIFKVTLFFKFKF